MWEGVWSLNATLKKNQLYRGGLFYWWWKQKTRRKSLTNLIGMIKF
jgi:hypothetical protein